MSLTGLSIDGALEASWNTIIYDTVRGYPGATLRGIIAGLSATDDVGGTIENATALGAATSQAINVNVGLWTWTSTGCRRAAPGRRSA